MGNTQQMHTITPIAKGVPLPFQEKMYWKKDKETKAQMRDTKPTASPLQQEGRENRFMHNSIQDKSQATCLAEVKR